MRRGDFQLRFAPMLLALKNAIASGLLGEVVDFDVYLALDTPWQLWSFLEGLPRIEIAMHSIHCLDAIRQILGDPLGVHAKSIALVEAAYASSAAPATCRKALRTAMEQPRYFEGYAIGERGTTSGRTITETDFVGHAGHTGDFFPHHMDAEFMKTQPFSQRIAHGTMVFSIGVGLTAGVINPAAFSYGDDRLRFVRPVFIGDTIHTRVTITGKEDDPKRAEAGRVTERTEVVNRKGEVALAADHIYVVSRRPGV